MFAKAPHIKTPSWPASRWSWLTRVLALAGIMVTVAGWQVSAQMQNFSLASGTFDERDSEFPGEDEEGNSIDDDLEAQLLPRRSPRASLRAGLAGWTSELLVVTRDSAGFRQALHNDRDAAARSAARLPLRC